MHTKLYKFQNTCQLCVLMLLLLFFFRFLGTIPLPTNSSPTLSIVVNVPHAYLEALFSERLGYRTEPIDVTPTVVGGLHMGRRKSVFGNVHLNLNHTLKSEL
jgi:hypothetical protein